MSIIQNIIQEQRQKGATVSEDLDNVQYSWKNGRLTRIDWSKQNLQDKLNLSGLDALTFLGCSENQQLNSLDVSKYTFSRQLTFASVDAMKTALTDLTAYINRMKEGSVNPSLYTTEFIASTPFSEVTLDGTTFIATLTGASSSMTSSMSSNMTKLTDNTSYADIGAVSKKLYSNGSIYGYLKSCGFLMDYSITFPTNVTESNGTISGATASWSTDTIPSDSKLIAVTSGNLLTSDTEAPVISGVKNNGLYRNDKLTVTDNVNVKTVTVNGVVIGNTKLKASASKTYKITAADANGNVSCVSFRVDSTKPVIKGIKNGKKVTKPVTLRFKDNYKMKSVTINGKKVNNKKATVKKAGRYVVKAKDAAGNVTKLDFRIA